MRTKWILTIPFEQNVVPHFSSHCFDHDVNASNDYIVTFPLGSLPALKTLNENDWKLRHTFPTRLFIQGASSSVFWWNTSSENFSPVALLTKGAKMSKHVLRTELRTICDWLDEGKSADKNRLRDSTPGRAWSLTRGFIYVHRWNCGSTCLAARIIDL